MQTPGVQFSPDFVESFRAAVAAIEKPVTKEKVLAVMEDCLSKCIAQAIGELFVECFQDANEEGGSPEVVKSRTFELLKERRFTGEDLVRYLGT